MHQQSLAFLRLYYGTTLNLHGKKYIRGGSRQRVIHSHQCDEKTPSVLEARDLLHCNTCLKDSISCHLKTILILSFPSQLKPEISVNAVRAAGRCCTEHRGKTILCPLDFTPLGRKVSYFGMLDSNTNKSYLYTPFRCLDKEEKHVTKSWEQVRVCIWARKAQGMALLATDVVGPTGWLVSAS